MSQQFEAHIGLCEIVIEILDNLFWYFVDWTLKEVFYHWKSFNKTGPCMILVQRDQRKQSKRAVVFPFAQKVEQQPHYSFPLISESKKF